MRGLQRWGVFAATMAAVVLGAETQAYAQAPPANLGWVYTVGKSGAGFFDADLAGFPSDEKITVCDNKSDGRGTIAKLWGFSPADLSYTLLTVTDPSNNGSCTAVEGNYFADGYGVSLEVCEYWGPINEANCNKEDDGVA